MKKRALFALVLAMISAGLSAGCYSTESVDRAETSNESSVVFTRPQEYAIFFGSHSLNEYIELTRESYTRNEAGQPVISLGICYRGASKWYNFLLTSPDRITFNARADFYGENAGSAPVYSTNNQKLVLRLGDTCNFEAVCPVAGAKRCQVVLSE